MRRAVNQQLWDQWRERMRQQADSGLTIAAFCLQHQIPIGSFYQWRRKLRAQPTAAADASLSTAAAMKRPSSKSAGREAAFLQLAIPATSTAQWIELVLPNGTIARLPAQNLAALEAVLRAAGLNG